MPVRIYKSTTPGAHRKNTSVNTFSEITKGTLWSKGLKKMGGRNNMGKLTVRHQGGGHKQLYRMVDFKQTDKLNIPGKVIAIEYDPNRRSRPSC